MNQDITLSLEKIPWQKTLKLAGDSRRNYPSKSHRLHGRISKAINDYIKKEQKK
jgi:hypothetical protein